MLVVVVIVVVVVVVVEEVVVVVVVIVVPVVLVVVSGGHHPLCSSCHGIVRTRQHSSSHSLCSSRQYRLGCHQYGLNTCVGI